MAAVGLRKIRPIRAVRPGQHGLVRCLNVSPSVPPSSACAHVTFHWCWKYSAHSSAEIRVVGEDVHLVTMAEKMQPGLLVTAKKARKENKSLRQERLQRKRLLDKVRSRTESTLVQRLSGGDNWGMLRALKVMQRLLSFCWTCNLLFCFRWICYFHEIYDVCQLGYVFSSY